MPPPIMLLSDGGHVENLAILPLLKKKLKKIIVVDGGYYFNEKKYGKDLLRALMLARRDLNCSFIGQGGRDVISDLLENFVKLQQPNEKKPRHFRYMSMILSVIYCHLFLSSSAALNKTPDKTTDTWLHSIREALVFFRVGGGNEGKYDLELAQERNEVPFFSIDLG